MPDERLAAADRAIRFFLEGIARTEIDTGGWDYLMQDGHEALSVIVTAPTLQALFEARRQEIPFDHAMVERGLSALERARSPRGTWPYLGRGGPNLEPQSSIGRSLACECTLLRAGRSDPGRLRGAIEGFFAHWEWLEKQRGSNRPHAPPYLISTYYFFYAHYYASMAIELLPEEERGILRRRLAGKIASVRLAGGAWSDRTGRRPQLYGTAMAVLVLAMPVSPPMLTRWEPAADGR